MIDRAIALRHQGATRGQTRPASHGWTTWFRFSMLLNDRCLRLGFLKSRWSGCWNWLSRDDAGWQTWLVRDIRTVRRWKSGESPVPKVVVDWLREQVDNSSLS